ncbi:MAG: hypothetical protein M0D57_08595 [Sphingobacteriales bacterium JAD_PAG50586_3]|nr:MAG: hypothetical protein M0D57_08595 [Sphingobacteriales bacterium JAD_PAG50586_3]
MQPLPSSSFSQNITADLLSTNKYDTINAIWQIKATTSHFVATKGDHFFTYELDRQYLTDECLPDLCYSCVYDLNITVTDACGVSMIPDYENGITQTVGTVDTICGGELHFELNPEPLEINLDIGTYIVNKTLTINTKAIKDYWDLYVKQNTCIKTLDDFEEDFLADVDFSTCGLDCNSCNEKLGLYTDHNDTAKANPANLSYDPNYVYLTQDQYDIALANCDELCDDEQTGISCDIYKTMLQADVMPGGQYAKYKVDETGSYVLNTDDRYSIFYNPTVGDEHVLYYKSIQYHINGDPLQPEIVVTLDDGVTTKHVDELSPEEFDKYFDNSWLPSLIQLHPEYCRSNFLCTNLSGALDYNNTIMNINNAQDALDGGYYNPTDNDDIPAPFDLTNNKDPLFIFDDDQIAVMEDYLIDEDFDNNGTNDAYIWTALPMV